MIFQVESYQNTLKMAFTALLLGAHYNRISVENKPASLLAVSLGKALNEMPPSLCGRQVVGPSSLPVGVASLGEDSQTKHERSRSMYVHTYTQCLYIFQHNAPNDEKELPDLLLLVRFCCTYCGDI